MLIACKVAKAGYYGGDVDKILYEVPYDLVLNAFHYENFINDYEATYFELNKPRGIK